MYPSACAFYLKPMFRVIFWQAQLLTEEKVIPFIGREIKILILFDSERNFPEIFFSVVAINLNIIIFHIKRHKKRERW